MSSKDKESTAPNVNSTQTKPSRLLFMIFMFGVLMIGYGYGLVSTMKQWFPYNQIADAKNALDALVRMNEDAESGDDPRTTAPSVRHFVDSPSYPSGELILIGGFKEAMIGESPEGCLAWMVDRDGNLHHVWPYKTSTWDSFSRVTGFGTAYPVGFHLYDDGGLLVTYQKKSSWPYAVGIVRFDRDGKELWKHENFCHHWFSVASDGKIYVPSMKIREGAYRINESAAAITPEAGKFMDDTILILNADGTTVDEISMLEALSDSGYVGLYQGATGVSTATDTQDPLHLNDVRVVGNELANRHDWLEPDDLLVSFRSINTLGILNSGTRRFKWLTTGGTLRQHSPRFVGDSVVVFDNLGGPSVSGGARVAEIDLATRRHKTILPRAGVKLPGKLRSQTAGHIDVHRDGERMLVTVAKESRIWEVDIKTGNILWEYRYTAMPQGIYTAKYVYDPSFAMNRTKN